MIVQNRNLTKDDVKMNKRLPTSIDKKIDQSNNPYVNEKSP